jgi:hypothetical protein
VALPSLDNVPIAYIKVGENVNKPLEVPDVFLSWLTTVIGVLNEALQEIEARLTAGGL